jgi:hypothetical protein|tara:strand:+ start:124 stop:696 length:573 start_codon:yes stop_codon:yes gene_type:complete
MASKNDILDLDPLDQPIPGSSLTAPIGSRTWDSPPQIADPNQAVDEIIAKIENNEKAKDEMLNLLAAGTPIEAMVNTISFMGFVEGKWSPDTAELVKGPVGAYLVGLAEENNIEATIHNVPDDEKNPTDVEALSKMMASNRPEQYDMMVQAQKNGEELPDESNREMQEVDEILNDAPMDEGGFMERRGTA